MSYTCRQEIIVIEDSETCNRAFEDYILKPALQFIGLDCEWNTNRPVSLLQIATPTIVLLVRVCKLNFTLPENAKLVLEDPTIYKVGVNIENDSDKLGEDCFCKIKSWVDLRHVAIRSKSWAKCIVEQVENLEFTLQYYDQVDQNSESAKQANVKRLCWCPKMGLESLIADCMVRTLPKNTSARWSDNWESNVLQSNQKTYAANDATASLDIFVALVYSSVSGKELPVDETFDVAVIVDKYLNDLENACKGLLDATFMQTKEDMNRIYGAIEATAPDLDIKAYYTKPQSTKSKKEKNERKEFYKKKARESATQKPASPKNTFPAQPTPVKPIPVKMHTESEHLPTAEESDLNPDLDSSRGSHTILSKNSKSKGRGRGRGMAASSIGSSRNMDSDGDINLKKGRGRGRGAIVSETRAPKSDAGADFEPEKVAFDSYDIRYQDADEGGNRPNALNLDDRSRRPTESSVSSAATIRSDHLPASEPASLKTPSTEPQITLLSPSPGTTPNPKGVLFLTDSVLKHIPESFLSNVCGSGLRCTKKVNYRLTQVFGYTSDFPHFDYVIIACGVNDLARYDHTPQSLAASVIPRLRVTCSRYKTTIFLYSAIIETKHGWLNSWISEFNTAMFEFAAQVPNLFFFDAQNVLEKDPITHSNFGRNVFRDDIHITDKARRVIANELVSGIKLLVNLDLERFDQARIQLKSWDWPLRSSFLERRRCFLPEFFGAIPSF
ncbi:uncharacterized protein LOC134826103 isoform X3 [Bolinopsis microptera]|uniref:uncharacterized protein LOC134826103 isoform X3 n=1 Tax=Bolinopsis microptera TaxID=2820187 RepID=UPI00307AFDD0